MKDLARSSSCYLCWVWRINALFVDSRLSQIISFMLMQNQMSVLSQDVREKMLLTNWAEKEEQGRLPHELQIYRMVQPVLSLPLSSHYSLVYVSPLRHCSHALLLSLLILYIIESIGRSTSKRWEDGKLDVMTLILIMTLQLRYYYLHFTAKETDAQRRRMPCSK